MTLSRSRGIYVFAMTLLVSTSTARTADTVSLTPKHAGDKEIYVEFDTESVQNMEGPDKKPMQIKTHSTYGLLEKANVKGSGVELDATLDRLFGFMSFGPNLESLYDTDDPDFEDASPSHKEAFTPLLNMTLKIALDGKGGVTALQGGESIRKKLTDLGDQNFVGKMLAEGDFTDAHITSRVGAFPYALYPHRDVKVGDTWTQNTSENTPNVGRTLVQYHCKLDRIEKANGREQAIISFKGTLAKDSDEKPAKDQRLGKVDGEFTGTARFDLQLGCIIEIQRESKSKIEVPPWGSKDPAAPLMKIEDQTKVVYTVTAAAERQKRKAEIARRVADVRAKREAEEAAMLAGPVDPATPENAPVAWLQFGGPDRNFSSSATGLANRWPKGGPPKLWERPLGDGFSAILGDVDVLYTMYSIREKEDAFKGEEVVVALDAKTGKTLWEHKYPAPWPKDLQMEFGPGPHSTPIVVGDRIFTVGCTAKLFCLDKQTGKPLWSRDLHEEYKAGLHMRGYGASPLAYKGNILLPVSKEKGHAIIAFKQEDGSVAWKGGEFEPGYASLLAINVDGVEEIVAFTGKSVEGLDPSNGNSQWSIAHPTQWGANISTPLWHPEDNCLFVSSAYGMGSRGVKLDKAGSQVGAKEMWFNNKMKIQHGDAVRVGDWVYGSSGDFGPAFLACVHAKTGEFGWRQRGIARANVLYADGKLIVLDEDGALFLVKADPAKYRLLGKATGLCKKTAWTVPTLIGRILYLRDREKIMAMDLGAKRSVADSTAR